MSTARIDPLKLARSLEDAGFEHDQACELAEVLAAILNNENNPEELKKYFDMGFFEPWRFEEYLYTDFGGAWDSGNISICSLMNLRAKYRVGLTENLLNFT